MLFGVTLCVLGLQSFYLGCIVQVLHDYTGAATRRWLSVFRYTRAMLTSAACSSPVWCWLQAFSRTTSGVACACR